VTWEIREGDVREVLASMAEQSIHCTITSPPYWALRDYGIAGQLGLEPRPDCLGWATGERCGECYVCRMVEVFRGVKRVLRDDGVCAVNMGDSYATGAGSVGNCPGGGRQGENWKGATTSPNRMPLQGIAPKNQVLMPHRLALALQADGWIVRSTVIWAKGISFCEHYSGSVMPEACRDRPTTSHEYVFLLAKKQRYFWDLEAVRERCGLNTHPRGDGCHQKAKRGNRGETRQNAGFCSAVSGPMSTRNLRTVWAINPQPFTASSIPGNTGGVDHFATFPEALVRPLVRAGTSARGVCPACGAPWERDVEATEEYKAKLGHGQIHRYAKVGDVGCSTLTGQSANRSVTAQYRTTGWRPTCGCDAGDPVPATVLDPFSGSGTTGVVAGAEERNYVGIELNPAYAAMSRGRLDAATRQGLLPGVGGGA